MVILKALLYIFIFLLLMIFISLCLKVKVFFIYKENKPRIYLKILFFKFDFSKKTGQSKSKIKAERKKMSGEHAQDKVVNDGKNAENKAAKTKKEPELFDVLKLVLKLLEDFVPRFAKAIFVHIKSINIIVGKEDAADTAVFYGRVCAIVGGICAFENLIPNFSIADGAIFVDVDYESGKTVGETEIIISARGGKLVFCALHTGIVYLLNK